MRKRITALLLMLVCLAAVFPAAAETGFRAEIEDAAGLLSAAERDRVLAQMQPITEYCNAGFFTTREPESGTVITRAGKWGKKTFGSDSDAVVFIIDMSGRELAVWSSDRMLKTLSTPKARQIVGNVYKMASNGKYADCAEETFREIAAVMNGGQAVDAMHYVGNGLMALAGAILLTFLLLSTRMEQEVKVSLPVVVTATAGVGAAIMAKHLKKVVHHESSSGGGGFSGGGGGGGGGGGASHGF